MMTPSENPSDAAENLSSALYEVTEDWVFMDETRGPLIAQKVIDEMRKRGYSIVPSPDPAALEVLRSILSEDWDSWLASFQ